MQQDIAHNDNTSKVRPAHAALRSLIAGLEGGGPAGTDATLDDVHGGGLADMGSASLWALRGVAADDSPILWVGEGWRLADHGVPYGPGLAALGIDPARLVLVRARRPADALWAIEEGLRSGAVGLVIGEVAGLDLTASRRLSLAAREAGVPCVLVTLASSGGTPTAFRRERVVAAPGTGARWPADTPRLTVHLDKHRGGVPPHNELMEWSDASHSFRVAPPLAGGPLEAPEPQQASA